MKVLSQRVWLAERDSDVRRALALLLRTTLGIESITESGDVSALASDQAPIIDLLIVDWANLAAHTSGLLPALRQANRHLKLIILSTRPEDRGPALAAGADAFISKVEPPTRVVAIVRNVLQRAKLENDPPHSDQSRP